MKKVVKRFEILDERYSEGKLIDISVAFWYEDGTKEIIVMSPEVVKSIVESNQ